MWGLDKKIGRTSFLKKRSKKLLLIWLRDHMNKSFLVLFFKKELLAFQLPARGSDWSWRS